MATTQRLLGDLARSKRNYEEARQWYSEALAIANQLGDQPEMGRLFLAQAKLMIDLGQPQHAILLLSGALATYKEMEHARGAVEAALPYFFFCISTRLPTWKKPGSDEGNCSPRMQPIRHEAGGRPEGSIALMTASRA